MDIQDYIIKNIRVLTLESSVNEAQVVCETYPLSHVVVVEEGKYLGCFAEGDIRTLENKEEKLKDHTFLLHRFFVDEKATVLDLISQFADNDSNLIPVSDSNNVYKGVYDLSDILDVFTDSPFLHRDSELLVVEKVNKDFSMSQVAQIVESNNSKLLGAYVSNETLESIQVTLKIRTVLMNEIIQTFRRYDYVVVNEHVADEYLEELKDRAAYFKRYLDV